MSKWLVKKEAEFNKALDSRDVKKMRELFSKVPTVDLAEFADNIEDPSKLTFIFKVVKSELTADFFTELDDDTQEALLKVFSDNELVELINKSYTDDIVDVLEDMPANLVSRALKACPKERREAVNKLLNYKDDTAASIMTTEYLEFRHDMLIKDALEYIHNNGRKAETVYTIFLRDEKRNLIGTCDLDEVLFANPEQKLSEIKNSEFLFVKVDTDQEEVALIFKKYDLNAIAVVNNEQKLVGVITFDDIMDVIEKEASEDIALQAGVMPLKDEYQDVGPFKMALKCAPWLIILIIVGVFSSLVISKFEDKIKEIVVLAAFIPVIMDTGGNAGGQTCSMVIRSLALKEFTTKDFWKIVWKELRTAMLTGAMVAIASFALFIAEMSIPGLINYPNATITQKVIVSAVVSFTLFFAIVIAKFVACILPFIAKKFKKDPALMSEPFVTTIVDFTALLIYFGIVTIALKFVTL